MAALNHSSSFLIFNSKEQAESCCEKINLEILAYVKVMSAKNPELVDKTSFPIILENGFRLEKWNNITQAVDYSSNSAGELLEKWYIRKPFYFSDTLSTDDYSEELETLSTDWSNPNEIE